MVAWDRMKLLSSLRRDPTKVNRVLCYQLRDIFLFC